ncbi:hypothetical protein EVAR_30011_1 [Eumeta japonica]|uniref:Uncharacterized protein n=1 Tax=Eumeta variegata TaxID=151549 RepID=A0A4C1VTE1_EUMVA|nr:hypothetical protein EVAR_30011_1 [Eumeta japonica]
MPRLLEAGVCGPRQFLDLTDSIRAVPDAAAAFADADAGTDSRTAANAWVRSRAPSAGGRPRRFHSLGPHAGSTLVTPLRLRVSMGGDDRLLTNGSRARLPFDNVKILTRFLARSEGPH